MLKIGNTLPAIALASIPGQTPPPKSPPTCLEFRSSIRLEGVRGGREYVEDNRGGVNEARGVVVSVIADGQRQEIFVGDGDALALVKTQGGNGTVEFSQNLDLEGIPVEVWGNSGNDDVIVRPGARLHSLVTRLFEGNDTIEINQAEVRHLKVFNDGFDTLILQRPLTPPDCIEVLPTDNCGAPSPSENTGRFSRDFFMLMNQVCDLQDLINQLALALYDNSQDERGDTIMAKQKLRIFTTIQIPEVQRFISKWSTTPSDKRDEIRRKVSAANPLVDSVQTLLQAVDSSSLSKGKKSFLTSKLNQVVIAGQIAAESGRAIDLVSRFSEQR